MVPELLDMRDKGMVGLVDMVFIQKEKDKQDIPTV